MFLFLNCCGQTAPISIDVVSVVDFYYHLISNWFLLVVNEFSNRPSLFFWTFRTSIDAKLFLACLRFA